MVYQVLARKWRPKSFSDLKGQEHVTRALMNALTQQQLHHAYLFTGTRGIGKTTIARILAKSLNCEQGIVAQPCGQCGACLHIDKGSFIDLIEVDAASRTRVEDTREILDNVQYAPSQGRFKIYLIDEVHMLSGHSFNALLKTLEEPPSHVKFILATTDPERIPVTVLSRCLRFSLRPLSQPDIMKQLEQVLLAEKISFEPGACQKIAHLASGSMRDALSLLEQVIAYGNRALKVKEIDEMLGLSYQQYMPDLLMALGTLNIKHSLQVVEEMVCCGADFEQVLASILQALHAIAMAQVLPDEDERLFLSTECDSKILSLKDKLMPEEVQLLYQIGLMGQRDLRFAPDARTGFEMILLRMIAFRPVSYVMTQKHIEAPAPLPSPPPSSSPKTLDWAQLSNALSLTGLNRMIVKHCVVSKWDGKHLMLMLEEAQKACLNMQRQTQIQEAVSEYFNQPIKVTIMVGKVQSATPLMQVQTKVKEAIEQDKTVQTILSTFGATVEETILNTQEG